MTDEPEDFGDGVSVPVDPAAPFVPLPGAPTVPFKDTAGDPLPEQLPVAAVAPITYKLGDWIPGDLDEFPILFEGERNPRNSQYQKWLVHRRRWQKLRDEYLKEQSKREGSEAPILDAPASTWDGKPTLTHDQNMQWVYDHMGVSDIEAKDTPSSTVWWMWQKCRSDPQFAKKVVDWAARPVEDEAEETVDPEEIAIGEEQRKTDRELTTLINRIAWRANRDASRNNREPAHRGPGESEVPGELDGTVSGADHREPGDQSGRVGEPDLDLVDASQPTGS